MHEFSLASEIIEISTKAANNANKSKITSITIEIGELSGVEKTALLTALESLMDNKMLDKADIITKSTRGKARCSECNTDFAISDMFTLCPNCNSYFKDIIAGKEFNVLSIDAE